MIRFVFRNFPYPAASPARRAGRRGRRGGRCPGKFWAMYELLLRPVVTPGRRFPAGYAERVGLDVGRFSNEVTGNVYAARIENDVREGIRNGVNATPKFYVDGAADRRQVPAGGSGGRGPGRGNGGLAAITRRDDSVAVSRQWRYCPDLRLRVDRGLPRSRRLSWREQAEMNPGREPTSAPGHAGPVRGPSAGLYFSEPVRGLAGLGKLPLAAPWLAAGAARRRSRRAGAAGLLASDASTACCAGSCAGSATRRGLESRSQSGPDRCRYSTGCRGAGRAGRAHRRAGIGDRLEPGRHLRQGTGPPASGAGPPGHHPGQPVRADRRAAEPGRPASTGGAATCTRPGGCRRREQVAAADRRSVDGRVFPAGRHRGLAGLHRAGDSAARERRGPLRPSRIRGRPRDVVADRRPARGPGGERRRFSRRRRCARCTRPMTGRATPPTCTHAPHRR